MKRTFLCLSLAFSLGACTNNKRNEEAATDAPETKTPEAATTQTSPADAAAQKPTGPEPIPAPEDVAAAPADAGKSASGLTWRVLTPGTGTDKPTAEDRVVVHYTGWTKDGKMFDSSVLRGKPATFGLNRVIKGWTEGVQLMTKGEKRRFWIPADLAYGETARRPGAPSGQLTFDVELIDIVASPKVPEDVAAPSATAKKTATGLAYRALSEGKAGGKKPTATSRVTVHYSGWTKDGKMFDSSVVRGEPATFGLDGVIAGWTEGLQLMKAGDKFRFWIPGKLAYGDTPSRPGAPTGQLTFDVELLDVN